MSQARAPCPNCDLPFYADRNAACPYCGSTVASAPATGANGAGGGTDADRSRVTCPDCGLPHYGNGGDCPYCEAAGAGDTGASEATTADAGASARHPDDTAGTTDPRGETASPETGSEREADSASTAGDGGQTASRSGSSSGSGGILGFIKGLFGR